MKYMKEVVTRFVLTLAVLAPGLTLAQTQQAGAETEAKDQGILRIDRIEYRPARWETEALREVEQDTPNRGGLIHVYVTNTSDEPREMAFFRLNGKDESHWLLGRFLAWHRWYDHTIQPGQMTVLEVNAVSEDFAEGKSLSVALVDRTWEPVGYGKTVLSPDPARVSSIVMPKDLASLAFHVRYGGTGTIKFASAEVVGRGSKALTWSTSVGQGPGHAIGRMTLERPLAPSELLILRVGVEIDGESRTIYAHRRAFIDYFPIGAWSGSLETYGVQRQMHMDTLVEGGRSDSPFFSKDAQRYGLSAMVHASGVGESVDTLRDLGSHPAVRCWMLDDEPDWSKLPSDMMMKEEGTKSINRLLPTMITLCRNVKFFEYASIPDIPCMDHYCVGAPTSSVWRHLYGTRLEETAYYTRDLKEASEPKPIWIWSQGIAGWEERPKRYCPTPEEIAAQLLYNVGRGAKGILWFNYGPKEAELFPDSVEAMKGWGRVLRVVREDLLVSDPIQLKISGPDKLDIAALATTDTVFLCLSNQNYEIHPEAYPFTPLKDVVVNVALPEWIKPAQAVSIGPEGIRPISMETSDNGVTLRIGDITACALVALQNDATQLERYQSAFENALAAEKTVFE